MAVEDYNETTVILELAALYGIDPSLISLDKTRAQFFVECRINMNTRTYSHPGGRPRGEGLAPPLPINILFMPVSYTHLTLPTILLV